jgi:SH3 domain-containing YSC84-like protein 1
MNTKRRLVNPVASLLAMLLTATVMTFNAVPAFADDKQETTQLVEKARFTLENFMADSNMGAVRDLIRRARGVFIAPQIVRGAFVFGISGGSGVFLVRDEKTRNWEGPAFYTVGGVSFGLQIGAQSSEVILLVMTDRGVSSFLASNLKLGADAGIAAGPVGLGAAAASANLSVDILSFLRSEGLYGGISLEGAVVKTRGDWNDLYYDRRVTATDILVRRDVRNPQADKLISVLTQASGK